MTLEEMRSRKQEAEQIIEDVVNNLMEDMGIQVTGVDFEIVDVSVVGNMLYKAKVRIGVEL